MRWYSLAKKRLLNSIKLNFRPGRRRPAVSSALRKLIEFNKKGAPRRRARISCPPQKLRAACLLRIWKFAIEVGVAQPVHGELLNWAAKIVFFGF